MEELNERMLSKKSMNIIQQAMDKYAKEVFGDKYGEKNQALSNYFPKGETEIYNNADIPTGLFSIGNQKLSDQVTLLINFTSAMGCPSMNYCPITQKACYAVAGENRLWQTKRKNLIVQNLVRHAEANDLLDGLFDIAELYIQEAKKTKKPIKYIRYNEAGDFTNQAMLIKAAEFSKKVRDKYNVISMAYTANKKLDPSQEINGEPIDTIIAMNRSRNDIPTSGKAPDRHFFGIPMSNFSSNPNVNLENAYCDVDYVTDANLQKLKVQAPTTGKYGIPSVPMLNKGSWDGGSGWYYICPCSFWKYNKDKALKKYLVDNGLVEPDFELPDNNRKIANLRKKLLSPKQNKEVNFILNKIISPCGTKCAVCHDVEGGITPDGQVVKDYSVLAATHGGGAGNYDADYAEAKRKGDDSVIYKGDENNPKGLDKFYTNRYAKSDAPINNSLFQRSKEEASAKNEAKQYFNEMYQRMFGTIF